MGVVAQAVYRSIDDGNDVTVTHWLLEDAIFSRDGD
jgi:hypothetical protein